jgi:hypothetical protein
MSWDREDVERWLNDNPLPADMEFRGARVWPRYALKKGYGFWLKTAGPYHPALRGLFGLIVEIIQAIPVGHPMPTAMQLMQRVKAWESMQLDLPLTDDDRAACAGDNPAEDSSVIHFPSFPDRPDGAAPQPVSPDEPFF